MHYITGVGFINITTGRGALVGRDSLLLRFDTLQMITSKLASCDEIHAASKEDLQMMAFRIWNLYFESYYSLNIWYQGQDIKF